MPVSHPINILFVCSRNQWRSPTAEHVWRKDSRVSVRSAGTSEGARRTVTEGDLLWADVVFVMEDKHKKRLRSAFADVLAEKTVHVLDIPDEYEYMAPALVAELEESVARLLGFVLP